MPRDELCQDVWPGSVPSAAQSADWSTPRARSMTVSARRKGSMGCGSAASARDQVASQASCGRPVRTRKDATGAVVEAEVHGGESFVAHGRDLLAHEHVSGEVEPRLGREPRQGQQQQRDTEHEPESIAARATHERGAFPPDRPHGQAEGERDSERRQRVDPARVQVALVDHSRNRDKRTERDGRPDEPARAAGDRGQRDRAERERVVDHRQRPREAACEIARRVDVVENVRRQPGVRDERRRRLSAEESPDEDGLS